MFHRPSDHHKISRNTNQHYCIKEPWKINPKYDCLLKVEEKNVCDFYLFLGLSYFQFERCFITFQWWEYAFQLKHLKFCFYSFYSSHDNLSNSFIEDTRVFDRILVDDFEPQQNDFVLQDGADIFNHLHNEDKYKISK